MKKILTFVMCCLIVAPAIAAKKCDKEKVGNVSLEDGEYILKYAKRDGYLARRCEDGRVREKDRITFCTNPIACELGKDFSTDSSDKRRLCVNESYIKVDESGNRGDASGLDIILNSNAGTDKNYVCYYCPEGTQYNSSKESCEDVHEQMCTYFAKDKCKDREWVLTEGGSHGCYTCKKNEKGSCTQGNRVFVEGDSYIQGTKYMNYIWTCLDDQGRWDGTPLKSCDNQQIKWAEEVIANRARLVSVNNPDRSRNHNNGSSFVIMGSVPCGNYECIKPQYVENAATGRCEPNSARDQVCTKTGGQWSGIECYCEPALNLKKSADGYRCECTAGSDYAWNGTRCEKTPAAIQREEEQQQQQQQQQQQRQRQQQQQAAAKKACVESGGDWANNACTCRAEKNIVLSNGKCECKNADFKFESAAVGCVEKDETVRRRACEAASETGAYWNGTTCMCNGADMVFVGGRCQKSADAAACEAAIDTVWNSTTKVCSCKKAGYEWNGTACEETAESIAAREEANRAQRITKSSATIADASKKLDDIMAGLKISVWKTAEGNFNGARLASDSIAGVVLGTAGGLITSHLVKKGQVKNGFEDVQCTVGGQKVADWGDEFTVGIR